MELSLLSVSLIQGGQSEEPSQRFPVPVVPRVLGGSAWQSGGAGAAQGRCSQAGPPAPRLAVGCRQAANISSLGSEGTHSPAGFSSS